jgi:glutamate--cysteine ligase
MSMKTGDSGASPPIESLDMLAAHLASGSKPKAEWRLGTEHEKFVYRKADLRSPSYDAPGGIRDILTELAKDGWEDVREGATLIGLKKGMASVSLEPAGQLELSGAPLTTVHETCQETGTHLNLCALLAKKFDLGFLGHGFNPLWKREDLPVMPKGRYAIMLDYMPKVGTLGLDMMLRTCTVQVNLDYASEADMIRKFRVSLALQPIATALFANSPFKEGKPNGYLSYRSHIWTDTDKQRTGMLPFVFEEGFGFERHVQYMLDVPMYFIYRDGKYINCAGRSFRDFLARKLPEAPGELPTMDDWKDHLSTAFPEVRLKNYLEMRGADSGPWDRICGLPALWVGLLYDEAALSAAWDLVKDWAIEEHEMLRRDVPRHGLKTPFRTGTAKDIAQQMVAIASDGLKARGALNAAGLDERIFLQELEEIAKTGRTPAEKLLELYHGDWQGDVTKLYAAESF